MLNRSLHLHSERITQDEMGKWSRLVLGIAVLLVSLPSDAQYRNYSLRCLAPLIAEIDPNAPKTLQDAFLSGPKYFAEAMDGIGAGSIEFSISTDKEEAQALFEQGVALLHVLWYKEAERAFRTVVELDPDCPMGYWGLAQANERRPGVARLYAKAASERCDRNRPILEQKWTALLDTFHSEDNEAPLTERSMARIEALEDLALEFPDQPEVRAFLIRRLTLDRYLASVPAGSTLAVDTLAREFAETFPRHPSRHYRVFLWLTRNPNHILDEARTMVELTPHAAEVWRYAAEAFRSAGQAAEAVNFAKKAIETDLLGLEARGEMPWESQNLIANYEFWVRLLEESGRIEEAVAAANDAIRLSRSLEGTSPHLTPLRVYPLMLSEKWQQLENTLESDPLLTAGTDPETEAFLLQSQALTQFALGNRNKGEALLDTLTQFEHSSIIAGISRTEEEGIARSRKTVEAVQTLMRREPDSETTLHLDDAALPLLVKARFQSLAGNNGEALKIVERDLIESPYRWFPTALFCDLAMKTGREREALFRFDRRFRTDAAEVDDDLPLLERLTPIAAKLRLTEDWTLSARRGKEVSSIETTASLNWNGSAAPNFVLEDRLGDRWDLNRFAEQPLLLNFFLGTNCAFCLEQFDLFAPHYQDFEAAGIQLAAISIDSGESLTKILGNEKEVTEGFRERFPFPVLADPELEAFHAFRVVDAFESGPMHATILISPGGRILWRNIGHLPFEDPETLLYEAKRLLQIHSVRSDLSSESE